MDSIVVKGGRPLSGDIYISGAKNATLPIMTAAILSDKPLVLENVPQKLTDIVTMTSLLEHLGVQFSLDNNYVTLNAKHVNNFEAPYDIVRKMRASIWVLGPLVARFGEAKVSFPGGCALGARQVDLHLAGLEAMGATIEVDAGYIIAKAKSGLKGTHFNFDKISVGATINIIMAAILAQGDTVLSNCAREPEISDLCHCLVGMGAKISGIGTDTVYITGVSSLNEYKHKIIPDRIEAGTYMIVGAITHGNLCIKNISYSIVENLGSKLIEAGVQVSESNEGIRIRGNGRFDAVDISTMPYPGFSTDLQAQYMALMTVANGTSVIAENIFENRFMHVPELCRMGAHITISGNNAIVRGVDKLTAAEVMASDLRASVCLILAGLAAEGETKVRRIYHLDRGYETLEAKLKACGADITRIKGDSI
jgi:UDP-N-acetylglucosamine 1-carboxyvinyltransferase